MKNKTDKNSKEQNSNEKEAYGLRQKIGIFLGPLLFFLISTVSMEGLSTNGQYVLAITGWMGVWWASEAVPLAVTSLLPLILFPLTQVLPIEESARPYADPNVLLLMGGFALAVTLEKWKLHKRLALSIILFTGMSPTRLVLGFMAATAFLSMWISNTATTVMMLPIALAVIQQIKDMLKEQEEPEENKSEQKGFIGGFTTCLLLSIAYAGNTGGLATLIGTPPNIVFAGFVRDQLGVDIGFFDWFLYAAPITVLFLTITWVYMTRIAYPPSFQQAEEGKELILEEKKKLGPLSDGEKGIIIVFSVVAFGWMSRTFFLEAFVPGITDSVIAIIGMVLTFLYPVDFKRGRFLNDWDNALKIPWGVLLLLGGGLSLAGGFIETDLADWIGSGLEILEGAAPMVIILVIVAITSLLSNVVSNTATTSIMLPIVTALASAVGMDNPLPLMIAATTAASFAFMLPVSSPPLTIVYGSDEVSLPEMIKRGAIVQAFAIVIITLLVYYWMPIAWQGYF